MSAKGWTSQRTPNRRDALDELDADIRETLPAYRARRVTEGRVVTGGFRMNAREWRRWRRRLDRLDRSTRR